MQTTPDPPSLSPSPPPSPHVITKEMAEDYDIIVPVDVCFDRDLVELAETWQGYVMLEKRIFEEVQQYRES